MFEKALKSISEENNQLKERLTTSERENEELKASTGRYKDEFIVLREQNLIISEENNRLVDEVKQLTESRKVNYPGERQSSSTAKSSKGKEALINYGKYKETAGQWRKRNDIAEARVQETSEESCPTEKESSVSQEILAYERRRDNKVSTKRSSRKEEKYLIEVNRLLQQQNETLKIQTMLMEEDARPVKDLTAGVIVYDSGYVGVSIEGNQRFAYRR